MQISGETLTVHKKVPHISQGNGATRLRCGGILVNGLGFTRGCLIICVGIDLLYVQVSSCRDCVVGWASGV